MQPNLASDLRQGVDGPNPGIAGVVVISGRMANDGMGDVLEGAGHARDSVGFKGSHVHDGRHLVEQGGEVVPRAGESHGVGLPAGLV